MNIPEPLTYTTSARIYAVDWDPKGAYVATGDESGEVSIWRGQSSKLLDDLDPMARSPSLKVPVVSKWLQNRKQGPGCYALSWGKKTGVLATAVRDQVRLWRPRMDHMGGTVLPDTVMEPWTNQPQEPEWDWVSHLSWNPDNCWLAGASRSERVTIWDALTGTRAVQFDQHQDQVSAVAWGRTGKLVASGDISGRIILWDPETGEVFADDLSVHQEGINGLSWSHEDRLLAAASDDGTVSVWDVMNQTLVKQYQRHGRNVLSCAFSPRETGVLASSSSDGTVRLWRAMTGEDICLFHDYPKPAQVYGLSWSPDGSQIAWGGWNRKLYIWPVPLWLF